MKFQAPSSCRLGRPLCHSLPVVCRGRAMADEADKPEKSTVRSWQPADFQKMPGHGLASMYTNDFFVLSKDGSHMRIVFGESLLGEETVNWHMSVTLPMHVALALAKSLRNVGAADEETQRNRPMARSSGYSKPAGAPRPPALGRRFQRPPEAGVDHPGAPESPPSSRKEAAAHHMSLGLVRDLVLTGQCDHRAKSPGVRTKADRERFTAWLAENAVQPESSGAPMSDVSAKK